MGRAAVVPSLFLATLTVIIALAMASPAPLEASVSSAVNAQAASVVWRGYPTLNPMAYARAGLGSAALNGVVYAFGGAGMAAGSGLPSDWLARAEAYNPTSNTWTALAVMPGGARGRLAAAAAGGKVYAIGGYGGSTALSRVEAYDPTTSGWSTTVASLPAARQWLGAEAVGGKIYAISGSSGSPAVYAPDVYMYDPATNLWTARANLPTPRDRFGTAVGTNGKIYAIGGYNGAALTAVDEYDPVANTWTARAPLPSARYYLAAAGANNGRIYAMGGYDSTNTVTSTVYEYDPTTNTWATQTAMLSARWGFGSANINNLIYVIGGNNGTTIVARIEEATVPAPPTATPTSTSTPVPPTATSTPLPPTATSTATAMATATATATNTATRTATVTATATVTSTATATPTATPAPTVPPNDDFASPIVIAALPYSGSENTSLATVAAGDPVMGAGQGANLNTVWFRFVAPGNGRITADTVGSNFDTVIAAWPGSGTTGAPLAANDDLDATTQTSRIMFDVISGSTYYLEAAGYAAGGMLTLNVSFVAGAVGPANDNRASATTIGPFPFTLSPALDTTNATVAADDPDMGSGTGTNSNTVWFTVIAPGSGEMTVDTFTSNYDTVLAAFVPGLFTTPLASNDDASGGLQSLVTFPVINGTAYLIEVAQLGAVSGGGNLVLHASFTTSAVATSTPTPGAAGPANDSVNSPTIIGALPFTTSQDTTAATVAAGDPDMGSGTGVNSNTVWFSFTAPASGQLTVDTFTSTYDTVLAAFLPGQFTTPLASNDDAGGGTQSQVNIPVTLGATYLIEVGQWGTVPGGGNLVLNASLSALPTATATATPGVAAPANDSFGSPTIIGALPFTTNQDTAGATVAVGDPAMGAGLGANLNTVWFRFVAPGNGRITADTVGSNFDTVIAAWPGSGTAGAPLAANDDLDTTTQTSRIVFDVTSGATYYLEAAGYSGGGMLTLNVSFAAGAVGPANDNRALATTIGPFPFTLSPALDTTSATVAADDPSMGAGTGANANTVWFKFVAPGTGDMAVDTFTSSYDTVLAIFALGQMTPLASNDDAGGGTQSGATFPVTNGATYEVEVAQWGSTPGGGNLVLHASFAAPAPTATSTSTPIPGPLAPANDNVSLATVIGALPFTTSQDTTAATVAAGDPNMGVGIGANANTVWFSFTPTVGGLLSVDTLTSNYDTVLAVFVQGQTTPLVNNDDDGAVPQSRVTFPVTPGTTYLIEVAQWGPTAGGGNLVLHVGLVVPTPTATSTSLPTATPVAASPASDSRNSPTIIGALPATLNQDTSNATVAADDPNMGAGSGVNSNTVWFRYTATASGQLSVDTFTSNYDTVLAVFLQGQAVPIASNDDTGTPQSQVILPISQGTVYDIEVAQWGSVPGGGLLVLHVSLAVPAATPTVTSTPVATSTPMATSTSTPTPTPLAVQTKALHAGWNWISINVSPMVAPNGGTPFGTAGFKDFFGTVTLDGTSAPVGAVVEAFSPRGDLVGTATVTMAGNYGYLRVYGEDTSVTPAVPGMRAGESVIFKVNGHPVGTLSASTAWQDDKTPTQVNFAASSNLVPIETALASIAGQYTFVLGQNGTFAPPPAMQFLNTLQYLEIGRAYMVRLNSPATLTITGQAAPVNTPLSLTTGWHWIGFLPTTVQSLPGALTSITGLFDYLLGEEGTFAPPPAPQFLNSLNGMDPGDGYIIRMTGAGTLVYAP